MSEAASSFLARNGIKIHRKERGRNGNELVIDCPVCGREKKCNVNDQTWAWQCFVCGDKGREYLLKKHLGVSYETSKPVAGRLKRSDDPDAMRHKALADALAARIEAPTRVEGWHSDLMKAPAAAEARAYLRRRGFNAEALRLGLIGWSPRHPDAPPEAARSRSKPDPTAGKGWITIPFFAEYDDDGRPVPSSCALVKIRNLNPDADKRQRYRRTKGAPSILYTPKRLDTTKPVVLVGGELDALSAVQLGVENVAAVAAGEGQLPDEAAAQLDDAPSIVVVYDNDKEGHEGAARLVARLGLHRCAIGRLPRGVEDWNDGLVKDGFGPEEAREVVESAEYSSPDGLFDVADLRARYTAKIRGGEETRRGLDTGWADIDSLFGGWRAGEVIYVTGTTGAGKSTFASQAALYRARQGDRVFFAPLELGPVRQYGKWIRQLSEAPPDILDDDTFDRMCDRLDALDISILYRRGTWDVEALRNTMMFAAARCGATFFVVDHLHWMMGGVHPSQVVAKLEEFMLMFTDVAKACGVTILVVGHPKKVGGNYGKDRDNAIVQNDDAKGASSITQIADAVISMWRPRVDDRSTVVDEEGIGRAAAIFTKVRDEFGSEGSVPFKFWPDAAKFVPNDTIFEAVGDAIGTEPPANNNVSYTFGDEP